MKRCGVTSKAGFQTSAPVARPARADVRHFAGVPLLDRNVVAVGVSRSIVDSGAAT